MVKSQATIRSNPRPIIIIILQPVFHLLLPGEEIIAFLLALFLFHRLERVRSSAALWADHWGRVALSDIAADRASP